MAQQVLVQTIGTTAVLVRRAERRWRRFQAQQQAGTGILYVGFTSGLSSTTGFALPTNATPVILDLEPDGELWAVASAASQTIALIEESLPSPFRVSDGRRREVHE